MRRFASLATQFTSLQWLLHMKLYIKYCILTPLKRGSPKQRATVFLLVQFEDLVLKICYIAMGRTLVTPCYYIYCHTVILLGHSILLIVSKADWEFYTCLSNVQ